MQETAEAETKAYNEDAENAKQQWTIRVNRGKTDSDLHRTDHKCVAVAVGCHTRITISTPLSEQTKDQVGPKTPEIADEDVLGQKEEGEDINTPLPEQNRDRNEEYRPGIYVPTPWAKRRHREKHKTKLDKQ